MLKGKLSISRVHSSKGPDYIHIELVDESSHCQLIEIKLTPEEYGNVISGQSYHDCEFELGAVDHAGKKREHKIEKVAVKGKLPYGSEAVETLKKAAKPFEKDGWMASISGSKRLHEIEENGKRFVVVEFVRYV